MHLPYQSEPASTDVRMRTKLSISLLCGLSLTLGNGVGAEAGQVSLAEEHRGPVAVEVLSGRSFTGEVDPRTDSSRLWLRWSQGAIVVLRPICWERVVRAEVAGETLSGEEFLQAVSLSEQSVRNQAGTGGSRSRILRMHCQSGASPAPAMPTGSGEEPGSTTTAGAGGRPALAVRSLLIEAWVANWDSDVEVDGLIVDVYALDADGTPVRVRGTLEVNLIGQQTSVVRLGRPSARLGRWTRQVRPADFGPRGFRYRLPFQSVHPEFDLEWSCYGTVHARLSVPGQGVFETTESTVRIRPYSAVRDQFQQATGERFLPLERTGRGRR